MQWIRERDALIAQTIAFVQSVTGRKEEFRPLEAAKPHSAAEPSAPPSAGELPEISLPLRFPAPVEPFPMSPPPPLPAASPRPLPDFRGEIQARIASFRKHQERFEREREEYCAATLARLRAAVRDQTAPPRAK